MAARLIHPVKANNPSLSSSFFKALPKPSLLRSKTVLVTPNHSAHAVVAPNSLLHGAFKRYSSLSAGNKRLKHVANLDMDDIPLSPSAANEKNDINISNEDDDDEDDQIRRPDDEEHCVLEAKISSVALEDVSSMCLTTLFFF